MADDLAKELVQRLDTDLKPARAILDSHLQDVVTYIRPTAASFTRTDVPGEKNRENILDNTAEMASALLTAAWHGFLTNPGTKWMGLRPRQRELAELEPVAEWLEVSTELHFRVFESPASAFATNIGQIYGELSDFGTGGLFVEDRPAEVPLYQARPLSELYIAQNNVGRVDTVFRDFFLTARQAHQAWGERAGDKVQKAITGNKPGERFRFLHAVFPRKDPLPGALNATNLPLASIWVAQEDKHTIRQSGFHEMPFIVPRLELRPGETYGRGRGMVALPDVKMLQREMKATIGALEQSIKPPLDVLDDGVVGPISLKNAAINFTRPEFSNARRKAIEPIVTGANPNLGEDHMDRVRLRIQASYFNNLLQISRDPRMTATQVLKIDEETLRVLGPVLGRLQSELLGPLIERTFGILLRNGFLPPPPPELAGQTIEVEYVSPIAKAQRLSEVGAVSQLFDVIGPLADRDPSVMDVIDGDGAVRHAADRLGAPRIVIRDPRLVDQMRKARLEVAEEKAATEQAGTLASAAQSAGQAAAALSGADAAGGGNA